jgi:hypothetical protein
VLVPIAVSLLMAAGPPVLTDPRGALEHAAHIAENGRRLEAADIALQAGDPRLALSLIEPFQPANKDEEARKLRVEVDAYVAIADHARATERLDRLAKHDGWVTHGQRQRYYLNMGRTRGRIADAGLLVYALALGWLVLVGSRELLRVYKETLVFAAVSVVAVALFAVSGAAVFSNVAALAAIGVLALVHASAAAMRRLAPSPRWRLILLVFLILGSLGAVATVIARMDLDLLLSAVFG